MLKALISASLVTTLLTGTAYANGPELLIEDFVGTIKIENGSSETISIIRDKKMSGVTLVEQGENLKIDGGIERPDGNKCKGYYGHYDLTIFKKNRDGKFGGYEDLEDYPQITLRVPKDTVLIIENSIAFLTAEDLGAADLDLRSCGKVNLGHVAGELRADIRGSADLTARDVGNIDVDIIGSGDLDIENAGFVALSMAGSGDADFANVKSVDVRVSGSGDISFGDVDGSLAAESRGSGNIEAEDITGDLIYDAGGSGDLDIGEVLGERISIDISGSGDVNIDGGEVQWLKVAASGASEVDYDGTTENADLVATGASDISVSKVTGEIRRKERGAADISVGN